MTNTKKVVLISLLFLIVVVGVVYTVGNKKTINNSIETNTTLNNKIIDDKSKGENPGIDSNITYSSYSICLENSKSGPDAKDCCDCLDADLSVRKACRDATVSYEFSKNTSFKKFEIPSTLGRNGDYSSYTVSGVQLECKKTCEATTTTLSCGDFQYCRTACDKLP